MDTDVDERAEGRDVRHHAFEDHTDLQIRHFLHAGDERGGGERGPRITTRLLEFSEDIGHRGDAESIIGEVGGSQ